MQDNPNLEIIDHNCMVSGHSHLEYDVDHGIISKRKDFIEVPIYGHQDWYKVMHSTGPKKCEVYCSWPDSPGFYRFFSFVEGPLQLCRKNSEGEKFSWHKAKWFHHTREYGIIYYKMHLDDEAPYIRFSLARRGFCEQ